MESGGWLVVCFGGLSPGASRTAEINKAALAFGVGSSSVKGSSLITILLKEQNLGITIECSLNQTKIVQS